MKSIGGRLDDLPRRAQVKRVDVSTMSSRVQFEQKGSRLTAVEIVRAARAPIIARLHGTLLALGIVVSSYQVRTGASEITERIVLERRDGGSIEAQLSDDTKAAILRLAIED
jgi:UTP:GlnB (protein PII) uridylyltransferase